MKTNRKLLIGAGLLIASSLIIPHQIKAASNFGTISIANPDNSSEGITIMDRNLGATSNDITSTDSYGYKYQRGNNYGFLNGCFTNQGRGCNDSVTTSSKGVLDGEQYQYRNGFLRDEKYNNSGYYEPIFYKVNGGPRYHWGEGNYHDGLWGGGNDNPNNDWGKKSKNYQDRQGPCPDGYHIPSKGEWGLLVKYRRNSYGKSITNCGDDYFYDDSSNFRKYFKLPYAGYRGHNDALLYQQSYQGNYRSSSPYATPEEYEYWDSQEGLSSDISEYARDFSININFVGNGNYSERHSGLPIRCFKNTYEPDTTENTTNCNDPMIIEACSKYPDTCPKVCKRNGSTTDCNDPMIVAACSKYPDTCPKACKRNESITDYDDSMITTKTSTDTTKADSTSKQSDKNENKVNETINNNDGDDDKTWYQEGNQSEKLSNGYSREFNNAYAFAYRNGITTMKDIYKANMDKPITRAEMAKMLSVYAMKELGMKPDTSRTDCNNFDDIKNIAGDLHEYIITSCQLGLMGQGITKFRPNAYINRAEFGTALSRTLWKNKYEGGTPYYAKHLTALQSAGIMKIIANAKTTQEIRGYVMLMLMRSTE